MQILDSIKKVKRDFLNIPFYHRGNLSLKTNTSVSYCLIPKSKDIDMSNMCEMVVSPVDFQYWDCALRINGVFNEMPGVISKLMRIMKEENLNIVLCESSSTQNRFYHEVELIVEASLSTSNYTDRTNEDERLLWLQRRIISMFTKEELLTLGGQHRLQVRRMKGLYAAKEKYNYSIQNESLIKPIKGVTRMIEKGKLAWTPDIQKYLLEFSLDRTLIISDTKERILTVLFPQNDEHYTFTRISHTDTIGALSLITSELAKAFDIIQCLCRKDANSKNDFEALLFSKDLPLENQESIRRKVIDNLFSHTKFKSWDLKISYPKNVGEITTNSISPKGGHNIDFHPQDGIAKIDENYFNLSTFKILNSKIINYEKILSETIVFDERLNLSNRIGILTTLAEQEEEGIVDPKIFVSYEFSKKELFASAEKELHKNNCIVKSGVYPDGKDVFREVIKERIKSSQGFLGIWTKDKEYVSSWLFWELGVAQAYDIPYRLIIHENIPSQLKFQINPEKNHQVFKDISFDLNLKLSVKHLLEDYKRSKISRRSK